jgi:NAD(P)-dependent dehydrogenase (short-subunit alcohol dehydrogenase family)
MPLRNFTGAVAVITGGASGIGLATARALYGKGAHVVLADINSEGLQQAGQLVHESNPTSPEQVIVVTTDVTKETQVQELMREAMTTRGRIDLVVTCAGIGRGGPLESFTGDDMQALMNVNFMGTYHCVRAALPTMRQQGEGHFVLLSSVAGKLCSPLLTGYSATKWAVRGFSSALRAELYGTGVPGIGVTTVYPAWVDTPMIHQESDAMNLLNIEALLTPDQVASEILQAVLDNKTDLTLAPNPDIARALQLMHDDQEKAEHVVGEGFRRQHQQSGQETPQTKN